MAGLNDRPHSFEDAFRAVQFAFIEWGFEQLHLRIASLRDHSKLQPQLFAGHHFADQISVQQQLVRLIFSLLLVPCRSGRLEISNNHRVVCFQQQVDIAQQSGQSGKLLTRLNQHQPS